MQGGGGQSKGQAMALHILLTRNIYEYLGILTLKHLGTGDWGLGTGDWGLCIPDGFLVGHPHDAFRRPLRGCGGWRAQRVR